MPKRLVSRTEMPFAPLGTNTYGLLVLKEVWETEKGEKIYWKYSLTDSVQIFGFTKKKKIIAISEFQPSVGTNYLHLPGETMEEGETPLDAARRGLLEETGYNAGSVELLSSIFENTGRSNRLIHCILALDCEKSEQVGEDDIIATLFDPWNFWDCLMKYFLTNPEKKHGGGNTLKTTILAFQKLDLLHVATN